jgi:hypothetical protein
MVSAVSAFPVPTRRQRGLTIAFLVRGGAHR